MNKKISLMLAVLLAISVFCMTACGGDKEEEDEIEKTVVKILANSACGEYCKSVGIVMEENDETIDIKISASENDVQNLKDYFKSDPTGEESEASMLMAQGDVITYAYNGKAMFKDGAIKGYSAVAACYTNGCQLAVGQYSGIASVADLKGKTVCVGEEGSSTELMVKNILKANGMKLSDMEVKNMEFQDAMEALENEEIDAVFFIAGAPERKLLELSVNQGTRLISIEGEGIDNLLETHKYYVPYVIPAGTYAGQEEDVNTIAVKYVITARDDADAEMVYQFMKTAYENRNAIAEETVRDAETDLKKLQEGFTIPLHPGAEKFYKEYGAL